MGFHIINIKNGKLMHSYAANEAGLAAIGIDKDSIIYQGEPHWTPEIIKNSDKYACWAEPWYRAGIKAQELFKTHARDEKLMIEEIYQDQESFKSYTGLAKDKQIKRGDFIIRNLGNIEVDIKCRTFYEEKGELFFYFLADHYYKHRNMMEITRTPIVIIVYQNINNEPVADNIRMFEIDWIKTTNLKMETKSYGKCFRIPVNQTYEGFTLMKKFQ